MRKTILLFALLAAMTASAQEWEKRTVEADEMKGTPAQTFYELRTAEYAFTMKGQGCEWSISSGGFKPDPTHVNHRSNFETFAIIGFYDADGRLIEKFDRCRLELTNMYRTATSGESRKHKGQYAVVDYLTTATGYVRIIIPTFTDDFDVEIPCINQKE